MRASSILSSKTATPSSSTVAALAGLSPEILRLRNMIPLRGLDDDDFATVVRHASVERRRAGQPLFRTGFDEHWIFYLLDGEIEISDDQGASFHLQGGSLETVHPLSPHAKARTLATVISDVCYVRMPAEFMRLKANARAQPAMEVEELSEQSDAIDEQLLVAVSHALMDGSFTLPTLPDISLRIRDVAANSGKGVSDLARLVQTDAAIAAYCVKVANSAAYPAATPAAGVHDAIMRMGVAATCDLITAFTLKDLYTTLDRSTQVLMRMAWQHSSRIAALSYVIARHTQRLNAEQALLGGLVHDIGTLVLLREWPVQSRVALDCATLQALAQELNGAIGSMVLRAWRFPDSIVKIALQAEQWDQSDGDAIDLSDCVMLAHAHDTVPPPWSSAVPAIEEIAAYRKLSDGTLSASRRLVMVEEAKQELRAVRELLGA